RLRRVRALPAVDGTHAKKGAAAGSHGLAAVFVWVSVFNAASSTKTLGVMLVIAVIGMPLVLAYTVVVYWTFRGKVKLDEHSD
ncbi:MAG TPA: cytochrome d ubiquinol oxidase subunit II, partial [Planctomycetota bacterium]|nr:cytochrome d ubiquinol oxidase subunit II [Planctomycetota bacterium]